MTVITSTILLTRRIGDLQRRRQLLLDRQDRARRALPEWTFTPLRLVGMSADEIRAAVGEVEKAQDKLGLDVIEGEIDAIDQNIEELENALLAARSDSLDGVGALLNLAIARLREHTPTDPTDLFYDYGDARVLRLLEHAAEGLDGVTSEGQRRAG